MAERTFARFPKEQLNFIMGGQALKATENELRTLFKRTWDSKYPQDVWADDSTHGNKFYNNHKPSKNDRYDSTIKEGDTSKWDMTVLYRAFETYEDFAPKKTCDEIKKVKDLRNDYAHSTSKSRNTSDYEENIQTIRDVFKSLGLNEKTLNDALDIDAHDEDWLEQKFDDVKDYLAKTIKDEVDSLKSQRNEAVKSGEKRNLESRLDAGDGPQTDGIQDLTADNSLPDWFAQLDEEIRLKTTSEQDLARIVPHIGSGWDFIAIDLGAKTSTLEKIKVSIRNPDSQMMAVFVKWLQKESKMATRQAFIKALYARNDSCTIDWEEIEKEFNKFK